MNAPYPPPQGQPIGGPAEASLGTIPPQGPAQNAMVPPPSPVTHDVTILRTKNYAQAKVEACAPEEIGWGRNTRTIKDCTYFFHSPPNHTEGSLIAEGYDEVQIKELPTYNFASNSEELARDTIGEENFSAETANRTTRPIQVTEHYIKMDYEGNDKPCLYKVTTGGGQNEVLTKKGKPDVEEADVIPFAVLTPILQPHRLVGRSIADLVMDIQRINTALLRGVLDNSYMVANPRHEVAEGGANANTLDDLLTVRRNGIVRVKVSGTVVPLETQSIVGELLPVMTYMDQIREMRSGVTRTGQGVDANALQNQSATAVNRVFTMAQAKMKMIARVFAETGVKDLFWLLHATIRKHGQKAETVRLRNNWTSVDPREWKTRNDMTVQVGVGDGGKSQQFAQVQAIGAAQEKLLMGGKTNLVGDRELYNTAAEMARIMGHKNPDKFFNDPSAQNPDGTPKYPAPPPRVDPKVQAVQAQSQADQAEIALKAQLDQQKAADAKALAEVKADFEAKLKLLEAHIMLVQEGQKARNSQQEHHANMAETALGMVATAHAHDTRIEQMKHQPNKSDA